MLAAITLATDVDDDHSEHHEKSEHHEHHEKEFKYKCNNNKWVNYLLDEAPAEYGVYYGDKEPGFPTFIGYTVFNPFVLHGYIQIINPKGLTFFGSQGLGFSNDSSQIFYLKKDCHHRYDWINSTGTTVVPFAIEPKESNANGYPSYIARKFIEEKLYFGHVPVIGGLMFYVDSLGIIRRSSEYEVLTCVSDHCEFIF